MDGWLFRFRTQGFVDDLEAVEARVNENVGGNALAKWLSDGLRKAGIEASEPWQEDHGCDFSIVQGSRNYLCVGHIEEEGEVERDATVSLTHVRSLKDRLFGSNKFVPDDPLATTVFALLAAHPDVSALRRE